MNKKVFFIVPYPTHGASVRLRVEQFLPYLRAAGIAYKLRPFLTDHFFKILYAKGALLEKIVLFLYCSARRAIDLFAALFYDVIFIHREAYPVGPPIFEAILFIFGKKVVFDFDDAIYLPPFGTQKAISLLKCPWKTAFIIRHSAHVIAGNRYLENYARRFNKNITVIPTCIDVEKYKIDKSAVAAKNKDKIVIGWIGSHTTQSFLKDLEGVFNKLLSKYKDLHIQLVGATPGFMAHDRIEIKRWSLENELSDISNFDIGIMPLPDTEWTRGKCAFKAILYMSLQIPVVASPVGVNKDIIRDDFNGCLASTNDEWEKKLSMLIDDANLRRSIGSAGRETAVKSFSLSTNSAIFVEIIRIYIDKI